MGLDWMLYGRPQPGHEKELARLTSAINELEERGDLSEKEQARLDRHASRRDRISIPPWEEIGCPMIGRDQEADAWLRKHYAQRRQDPEDEWAKRTYREVLDDCQGVYVEELAREVEGIALVQGPLAGSLNFRGKVVGDAEKVLGVDLAEESFHNHTAEECLDFAARLDQAMGEYLEGKRRRGDEDELLMILAAGFWLRFWGGRGFGFDAWF
jgi:hypothetical protein